ncbi:MAG: heavy metal translocating P-type ATPase, partial [bacterium]
MTPADESDRHAQAGFVGPWWAFPTMRSALAAGGIAGLTWIIGHLAGFRALEPAGYALAMLIGGRHFFLEGLKELRHEREVGIEILMSAAAIGASILGLWDEAATLVFLYATAEALEEYAYARTRSSIKALLDLAPQDARVIRNGVEETVPATAIRVGDLFMVRPGEALPTDGVVREGTSSVDESPVTGESMPVEKTQGNRVFAGSVNRQGALVVEATATFEDNTLSKIIHLVEEAQEQKGRLQRFIERFGRRYSPGVLVAAFLLLLVPPAFGQPFLPWALRAVVLLVAAAPCALVMSMPIAAAAAIGIAGRHGVLIKGGLHLENLGRVKVLVFDKTGTLTRGAPAVTDVIAASGVEQRRLLSAATSVEQFSEHPLGRAIVQHARDQAIAADAATEFEALTGFGAQARLNGQRAMIGNPVLFRREGFVLDAVEGVVARLQDEGKTVVFVGLDHQLLGVLGLRDTVRPEAAGTIRSLHRAGIKTAML